MVEKINGNVASGESLTGNMNWFTIRTTLDITATGNIADAAQKRLNKLVEIISLRAQPVIKGRIIVTSETAPVSDLPVTASASGAVSVYTFKFAIEHDKAWDAEELAESLNGVEGFVYTTPTAGNNVSVVMNDLL